MSSDGLLAVMQVEADKNHSAHVSSYFFHRK